MTAKTPALAEPTALQLRRARIPFLSTSFARNVWYYALLWPVWWVLGIEQFLLSFFLLFEVGRLLIREQWRVRLNSASVIAILMAVWWIAPIFWVNREFLDIFLKETATVWSQALILLLFWNCVRSRRDWDMAVRALTIMAIYLAVAGMIFIVGAWRGQFTSLFGGLLPQSFVDASAFFSSITYRRFGTSIVEEVGLLPIRLMSFSLSFSSLSMNCLLLSPFMVWRIQMSRGVRRLFYVGVLAGLVLCLFFTESRISYLAFAASIGLYVVLRLGLLRGSNRPLTIALTMAGMGVMLIVAYVAAETIVRSVLSAFVDLRPSSWLVRLNIYVVTLRLLPEHLFAGWGVPERIPGAATVYSAGTHSSYLGVLFQHGIVGLVLYLALWLSIWKSVIRGLGDRLAARPLALFWIATTVAFFAFNIREVADSWWWDQSLTFILWTLWGLALTAGRVHADTPITPD
jgi:hypothetical protein